MCDHSTAAAFSSGENGIRKPDVFGARIST
jgi:hypothetical protein